MIISARPLAMVSYAVSVAEVAVHASYLRRWWW